MSCQVMYQSYQSYFNPYHPQQSPPAPSSPGTAPAQQHLHGQQQQQHSQHYIEAAASPPSSSLKSQEGSPNSPPASSCSSVVVSQQQHSSKLVRNICNCFCDNFYLKPKPFTFVQSHCRTIVRQYDEIHYQSVLLQGIKICGFRKLESFTTSKTDRHLLRQKFRQKISDIKTSTFDDI